MKDPLLVPASFYEAWRFKITPPSRALGWASLVAALGSVSVLIPVYQTFCGLAALLSLSWIAGWIMRPRLGLTGQFPEKGIAGRPLVGRFTVTNVSRWPALDVAVGVFALPPEIRQLPEDRDRTIPCLAPGESVTVSVPLRTLRRGIYELPDARAYSLFPFHLVRSGSARARLGPLMVLPNFHSIEGLEVPFGSRYQPGGVTLTSQVGESPEYIGNREYVPGEPARRLDFRSWARLGKPVVREYQEEYYCRVALILDTFVPAGRKPRPDGFPELESAVSLAASVADALSGGEYLIDLFAAGPQLYVFRSGRHTAHFENILEILAGVDACRDDPFETVAPAVEDQLASVSTAVLIFLDWDEPRRKLARKIVEAGCQLKIIIVRDGPTTAPVDADMESLQFTPRRVAEGGLGTL